MGLLEDFINLLVNLDQSLRSIVQQFGLWTYLILFIIIFAETGFVVTPFLPGDSLIFIAGTFAAIGLLRIDLLFLILSAAAILGDTVNYWIGFCTGPKIFKEKDARFFKKKYLETTKKFYEKYGGKTIVVARFIPVIRTFAPFVAGIGKMSYSRFAVFNVLGGIAWVAIFLFGGYFFGNTPIVRENLSTTIILIIFASFLPIIFRFLQTRTIRGKK